jgi:CYTH domain-containing protein
MNIDGFEIERKFLIAMPDEAFLKTCSASEITQTYLVCDGNTTERVRERAYPDHCEYTHTIKYKLNNMRRIEDERQIDEDTYTALLERADPARRPIRKVRYCFEHDGRLWELDVFPFWANQAFLEIELTSEDEDFSLPPGIRLIREVTDDPRYTNAALSFEIPDEEMN